MRIEPHLLPIDDEDDVDEASETVLVHRSMLGILDLPMEDLELIEEEVFSLDSDPEPTPPGPALRAGPPRFDWWFVAAAATGGSIGGVAALSWMLLF